MSEGNGSPAERAVRAMSHRKLKKAAERGNPLAQRILAEMSQAAEKEAAKARKKSK